MDDDVDDTVIRPRPSGVSLPDEDTVIRRSAATPILGADVEDTIVRPRSTDRPQPSRVIPPLAVPAGSIPAAAVPERVAAVAERVAAVPERVAAVAERVAAVRIGDRVVRLDRPVIVGRRPTAPRVLFGVEPTLVAAGRTHGQVSGSHVSVRAEGGTVVVEDLHSTNGTVVRPPGSAPYRLPSGASRVVLTGTLVEIGDGVSIEILSPHLRAAPGTTTPDATTSGPALPPVPGFPTTRERSPL